MIDVVYISFVDVILDGNLWDRVYASLLIDVIGYVPKDHKEVVDFITKLFRELYYELTWVPSDIVKDEKLFSNLTLFEYVVHELIKDKIYLTSFPYHTDKYEKCRSGLGDEFDCYMIHLYVDVDEIYKYVYHVEQLYIGHTYRIRGYHVDKNRIDINIEFYSEVPKLYCRYNHKFLEKVEKLAKDEDIHIDYYVANDKTKKLINTVLELTKQKMK